MSWSISPVTGPASDAEGLREKLRAASYPQTGYGEDESRQAIDQAIATLAEVAATGIVGPYVVASANGHANPGHTPEGGWSQDTFTLQLSAGVAPSEG